MKHCALYNTHPHARLANTLRNSAPPARSQRFQRWPNTVDDAASANGEQLWRRSRACRIVVLREEPRGNVI